MTTLNAKRILLLVTGGIAAYKAPDVVRRLREAGAMVRVVMTPAATAFITPLTLQAVSGQEVRCDLFDAAAEAGMGHIELARWADAIVVAPATADFIARLRLGLANDLATALCLAAAVPVLLAPAMNQQMWQHPATQDNLTTLSARGIKLAGPGDGSQACGETGPGRMLDPMDICSAASGLFESGCLQGQRVLITSGPTREAVDPVRYLTNHSSGKMGYAVASAALEAGATVTLISGPTALPRPAGVRRYEVESAQQMFDAVMQQVATTDIFIAAAAVADYRPEQHVRAKLKRQNADMVLKLVPNPDILQAVARLSAPPFTVGFAAETQNVEQNAREKLARKGVDMIAANLVGGPDLGFNADDNELHVIWIDGQTLLPRAPKTRLARALVSLIAERKAAVDHG